MCYLFVTVCRWKSPTGNEWKEEPFAVEKLPTLIKIQDGVSLDVIWFDEKVKLADDDNGKCRNARGWLRKMCMIK